MATKNTTEKARKKEQVITENVTRESADAHFAEYAKAHARLKQIEAMIEQQIIRAREKYQEEIQELNDVIEEEFDFLKAFAMQNRQLFIERKSIDTTHGVIGFRTGTPKLDKDRKFTWDAIVTLMRDKNYQQYIRTKEEVNKELLLNERDTVDAQKVMRDCKMFVTQEETFYVEPKEEVATKP